SLDENAAATTLARQMMEEILSRQYADGPGPSDSIFDYRNRTWPPADTLTTSDGRQVPLAGGGSYTRSSSVQYFKTVEQIGQDPETQLSPIPPVALVTVTVITPAGKRITLSQVIADY